MREIQSGTEWHARLLLWFTSSLPSTCASQIKGKKRHKINVPKRKVTLSRLERSAFDYERLHAFFKEENHQNSCCKHI